MKIKMWQRFLLFLTRKLLSLRYEIKVHGLKGIAKRKLKKESGILFLPNHPAEIDPVILFTILMKNFSPRPLVVEHFFYGGGLSFFMKLAKAFPIPHVETTANEWKLRQVEKAFATVKDGLRNGQNFLIYPSGSLKREGYETIGGSSFIHKLIHECPDVKIVLIRTTGLWGSCFSRALTGEVPDFWTSFKHGVSILLKNKIFFVPKRKVDVEFEIDPKEFPRNGSRLEINKFLEGWYNSYKDEEGNVSIDEPLKLVSYKRNQEVYPEVQKKKLVETKAVKVDIPFEVKRAVTEKIAEIAEMNPIKVKEEAVLASDLALDSLDVATIYTFLDEQYGVRDLKPESLQTVFDVMKAASGSFQVEEMQQEVSLVKNFWPVEDDRPSVENPDGSTLQEAFLRVCERMQNYTACADGNSGILSYKKLKLAALVLSQKIKKYEGKYIGVMLPSSVGTYLTIFATLLAGKIPVMLNWTAGIRSLEYAVSLLNLEVVLSSNKFLSKIESLELGDLDKVLVTLEDIKHSLGFKDKIKGLFLSRKKPSKLYKDLGLAATVREDDPAVILFTSGTETYPKAVPLSHRNILENQKAALSCVTFTRKDIFYGILPPFHSFGFNVTGILPILAGLKVYYSPDPTNPKTMAREVFDWKITVFCCAPTFFKNLFAVAAPKQLRSVKLFVTGAEKAPKELFEAVRRLGPSHQITEGYGITECAPMVTMCRLDKPAAGVGQAFPNIELCVIDPETEKELPEGQIGEICISGPSVFNGYIGDIRKNPFILLKGKKWYRSGDLGHLDAQKNLILGGRLKRFVKIGGEMVSLNALEEEIMDASRKKGWIKEEEEEKVSSAIGVDETKDRPVIVLFTTFDVTKEEVNAALRDSGFGRIMKISSVKKLDEIPITGTGKIHYRKLNELAINA